MNVTKAITVRLDSADYAQIVAEARRLGMTPGTLARVYIRAGLLENRETEAQRRRLAGIAALKGLAAWRARLPDTGSVDVVQLVQEGREELGRRIVP